ncbi:BMP family lipoprotein [Terrisporobacter glycolicus]|uniref:Membrane lipoprotein TmpC n=1 Tax=Terrisporobacter glycolicus ATCC 14880 = DSM 1288 TaxID=1121315 RepID=A0ABZ2F048_9FIRM|nr:BMP family ABC transporter substrate-binding protein [Terrisporobacter glycolicus]
MNYKKIVALSSAILIGLISIVGCTSKKNNTETKDTKSMKIGMVADVGGINDESFNQSAWEGLQKAQKELGVEVKVIESKQASEYIGNIETLADDGMDLIIGVGNTMVEDIKTQANNYPDISFAIIDETYDTIPKNITPILFKENEATFLAGLIAGKMTKTNKVGFIGGMENQIIYRFLYGYEYGVDKSNDEADVQVQFAGTFADAAKGKSIANQMYSNGVDVILSAAGGTGVGAIESAKEQNKYAIGVDKDQSDLAPKNVLTSALKKVNVGVYDTVKEFKDGKLTGGQAKIYGLKEDGVGIPESTKNLVPQDVLDYVNTMADKVKNGEIKVPNTEEELDKLD